MIIGHNIDCFAQNIYVDRQGNDRFPGTKEQPVATLEAARDLIRKFKSFNDLPDSGITVWINEGTYDLKNHSFWTKKMPAQKNKK